MAEQANPSSAKAQILNDRTYQEVEYLKKNLGPILVAALAEICIRRPADPIEYLGHWLLRWRYNEELKRRDVQNALEVVRQKAWTKDDESLQPNPNAPDQPPTPSTFTQGFVPGAAYAPPGYGGPLDQNVVEEAIKPEGEASMPAPEGAEGAPAEEAEAQGSGEVAPAPSQISEQQPSSDQPAPEGEGAEATEKKSSPVAQQRGSSDLAAGEKQGSGQQLEGQPSAVPSAQPSATPTAQPSAQPSARVSGSAQGKRASGDVAATGSAEKRPSVEGKSSSKKSVDNSMAAEKRPSGGGPPAEDANNAEAPAEDAPVE